MLSAHSSGSFKNMLSFLNRMHGNSMFKNLDAYGRRGVDALARSTPQDTGLTASSWGYEVIRGRGQTRIIWSNNHTENGFNVAVNIQYGHGTGTGGWVEGIDYINPALRSIFDQILKEVWTEVTRA